MEPGNWIINQSSACIDTMLYELQFSLHSTSFKFCLTERPQLVSFVEHINDYVECVKKSDLEGFSTLLNPPKSAATESFKKKLGMLLHFKEKRLFF